MSAEGSRWRFALAALSVGTVVVLVACGRGGGNNQGVTN